MSALPKHSHRAELHLERRDSVFADETFRDFSDAFVDTPNFATSGFRAAFLEFGFRVNAFFELEPQGRIAAQGFPR
jgi:hypothetical protein